MIAQCLHFSGYTGSVKGLFHLHLRKRLSDDLEPIPARTFAKRLLDRTVLLVGIVGPLTTIPQIIKLFTLHSAEGVSTLTWALPMLLDIPWIIYGIVHREPPIIVTYTLWFVMNGIVVTGALLYGAGY